jgi:transcriptional regulator with XRE-family HTH domain
MSKFAENLKKYRTAKGVSQEGMAKLIGVHSTHLSRYERGLSSPSIEVATKIAGVLEVAVDTLIFGDQGEQSEQSIDDKELLDLFKKVQFFNTKQKDTVKDLISAFILKADLQQKLAQ